MLIRFLRGEAGKEVESTLECINQSSWLFYFLEPSHHECFQFRNRGFFMFLYKNLAMKSVN